MSAPLRWERITWTERGTKRTAVVEEPSTDGSTISGTQVGPDHEYLGPIVLRLDDVDAHEEINASYFLVPVTGPAVPPEPCACYSCGGQCGGDERFGWCGPTELVDGRPICQVCREQADVFDIHRVGISARIVDDEHIALTIDPFETFRKVTARLTPREARHLAELLNQRAEQLEIHMRPLIGRSRADLEALCQAGNAAALAEWEAREQR